MGLTPVDKLEFLVLVDNCIEWFSALPPGFVHEVPQHLKRPPPNEPPEDPLTGLPVLDFANYCCGAHGLSILIMTTIGDKTYQVLMDGGPEHLSIERNVKAMAVELKDLDAIVLSHWHSDHSGGILKALELRQSSSSSLSSSSNSLGPLYTLDPLNALPVDLHPERPIRRGIAPPPKRIPIAVLPADPTFEQIESAGGRVQLSDEAHDIIGRDGCSTGVRVSGEIPRVEPFERGLVGAVTWMKDENGEEGWFTDEQILDERYVTVEVKGQGLVVFSSCSHAGICNVLTDAQTTYDRPIHMVVGGLHLVPTAQQPVVETVDFLSRRLRPTPKYVLPLHCTGLEARAMIRQAMGDACIPAGVGMRVTVEAKADEELDADDDELQILD